MITEMKLKVVPTHLMVGKIKCTDSAINVGNFQTTTGKSHLDVENIVDFGKAES